MDPRGRRGVERARRKARSGRAAFDLLESSRVYRGLVLSQHESQLEHRLLWMLCLQFRESDGTLPLTQLHRFTQSILRRSGADSFHPPALPV